MIRILVADEVIILSSADDMAKEIKFVYVADFLLGYLHHTLPYLVLII